MRVPDFKRYRKGMNSIAFFLCGIIVGAAIFNSMIMDQSNRIMEQNFELREQRDLAESQLQANKKVSETQSIVVFVLEPKNRQPIDKAAEAELKRRLKEDLSILIGRKVYDIGSDSVLVRNLIDSKLYSGILGKDFTVTIRTMLLADSVLQVWVDAKQATVKK